MEKGEKLKWAFEKYLVGVITRENFGLKIEDLKKPAAMFKRQTKGELYTILQGLTSKPLGFELETAPPVKWFIKVIYSLKPDHEMFKPVTDSIKKTIPKE